MTTNIYFKKSIDGILNADGSIKVEKNFDALQEIVYLKANEVHVKNRKGNKYVAMKHAKLDLTFAEIGDTAFITFKHGKQYCIGFRKAVKR